MAWKKLWVALPKAAEAVARGRCQAHTQENSSGFALARGENKTEWLPP
jgi:hypothetical protein